MSTFTATPLPDLAAVRLEVAGAAAGALPITRTDRNGAHLVRQLPGQETSAGLLVVVDYEAALEGDVRYDLEAPRTNLATNGDFELDVTGWTSSGGLVVTREAAGGVAGPGLAYLSGGAASALFYPTTSSPAAAGDVITASVYVKGTPGQTVSLAVIGYASSGASVSPFRYDPFTLDGTWQRISQTATLPATSVGVRPVLSLPAAGTQVRVDGVLVEKSDRVEAYVAGTDPAAPLSRIVTLAGTPAPIVTLPVRPQDRSSVKALEDYDEASQSPTVRHTILGGGTVANLRPLLPRTGTLTLRAATYEEAAHTRDVLSAAEVALFRQPTFAGLDLYLTVDAVRISPTSDPGDQEWRVAVAFAQADAPAGDLLGAAGWTIDDLVALGVTIADVPALFSTVYRLAVGPT